MKFFAIIGLLASLTVSLCDAAETSADFYVATDGSDGWSGEYPEPNAQRTDGPFASLERARDAVREHKQNPSDDTVVLIRGAGAGNVIQRNYIHHLVAPIIMQAAIRTDGGQTDTLIAENLIYKCTSQGILLKLNNRCENNIIADIIAPPRGYYLSLREGPMTGATIERNIFYASKEPCAFIDELPPGRRRTTEDRRGRGLAASKEAATDHNIYYCTCNPELSKQMLAKQQRDGVDADSLAVDPLFVDPANGDFRLRPDSPALQLGFVPFDMSKVGLRTE